MKKDPILIGEYSLYSILSFIFGFIFWPVSFVLGLIALEEIKKHSQINQGSKYLAWAGMLMQPIMIAFSLFAFALFTSRIF